MYCTITCDQCNHKRGAIASPYPNCTTSADISIHITLWSERRAPGPIKLLARYHADDGGTPGGSNICLCMCVCVCLCVCVFVWKRARNRESVTMEEICTLDAHTSWCWPRRRGWQHLCLCVSVWQTRIRTHTHTHVETYRGSHMVPSPLSCSLESQSQMVLLFTPHWKWP